MDQASLVEHQIDDGWKLITELSQRGFDVTAAFWLKVIEDGQWLLYIASKEVDDKGLAAAYKVVHSVIGRWPDLRVDPFEVKLIGATNPITTEVLDFQRHYPTKVPTRFRGTQLGGVSLEEAYIYPMISPP